MAPRPTFAEPYYLRLLERRPAPVFFVPAGPLLARIVKQPLCDILPDCLPAVEADSVHSLDFHDPPAAAAGDAQRVALDFRQLSLSHTDAVAGARIP
jgi:hypothetical protein